MIAVWTIIAWSTWQGLSHLSCRCVTRNSKPAHQLVQHTWAGMLSLSSEWRRRTARSTPRLRPRSLRSCRAASRRSRSWGRSRRHSNAGAVSGLSVPRQLSSLAALALHVLLLVLHLVLLLALLAFPFLRPLPCHGSPVDVFSPHPAADSNVYGLLRGKLTEDEYVRIVRNQILVDIQVRRDTPSRDTGCYCRPLTAVLCSRLGPGRRRALPDLHRTGHAGRRHH